MQELTLIFANVPHPSYVAGTKLVFVLGLTNVTALFLILSTCRCVPGVWRLTRLMNFPWYRRFFTFHCYFWYALGISVGAHAYVAWTTYGFPFR